MGVCRLHQAPSGTGGCAHSIEHALGAGGHADFVQHPLGRAGTSPAPTTITSPLPRCLAVRQLYYGNAVVSFAIIGEAIGLNERMPG